MINDTEFQKENKNDSKLNKTQKWFTGIIGIRIFNPNTSDKVKEIITEVESESMTDCIRCPEGCERCVPGEGKKTTMDARKWYDTRCVYCKKSDQGIWPKRFHSINGLCKLYTKESTQGYDSENKLAYDIGTPEVSST